VPLKPIGVFGWGVVAPKSPNIEVFAHNLESAGTWLAPFDGFGPDNFLVGIPDFNFEDYRQWVDKRFPPRHFQNLKEKMDLPALYAVGSFIQALGQNPGIEEELKVLGDQAHVYVGTGLGAVNTGYDASVALFEAQLHWNRFWSHPDHNPELRAWCTASPEAQREMEAQGNGEPVPPNPTQVGPAEQVTAEREWAQYWMVRSSDLHRYLSELAAIDGLAIEGEIGAGKLNAIREKEKRRVKLQERWNAPEPPWKVTPNFIWNIPNAPAAQISILGKITGLSFAPVAACSTFGVALKQAMNAIRFGEAKFVVVGATDPAPHPLTVGSFYMARVLSADRNVSLPLTRLQGTHVAGGAVVWIIGDLEYGLSKGFKPVGMQPVAVGVSSDAYHIITPSTDGPKLAINSAIAEAGGTPEDIGTWDLHATATPGDYSEVATLRSILPGEVLITARKGTFGHGMSAGGGWELTAQYLGHERGKLFPTTLAAESLNSAIAEIHQGMVFDEDAPFPKKLGGKLSMGIGGINACVISKPWD
jgi:3-oxoacyl-[acyl-carrier-protein] synthase II